jgi:outer membrane receptor protein involved in Fe transport
MPAKRSAGTVRSLTLINAVLMTTAFAVPAYAQIETVVVTAEKKAEDIQSVPIAVTAYSAQDLTAHQVAQFKDLQFSTPNVTYTKTNFTGTNFQIRGIGTTVISGDGESGVAFNSDDLFLANPGVDSGQFYDMDHVEILRGPQSTLYGRGATGGAVSYFSAKPKLDEAATSVDATYGNYKGTEVKAMLNVPIMTDKLGIRISGDWVRHDGFATNVYSGTDDVHPDNRDQWSLRGILRWQPTDNTTVDVIASHGSENDHRMRAQKQLCHQDPTGTLGCLPDALGSQSVNQNATYLNGAASVQATVQAFAGGVGFTNAYNLGLLDLSAPYTGTLNLPSDPRSINADFTPTFKGRNSLLSVEVKQRVSDWLNATLVVGYTDGQVSSQESYTNSPGAAFARGGIPALCGAFNCNHSLDVAEGTLQGIIGTFPLINPTYSNPTTGPYAFLLNPSHAGTLPVSAFSNLGIVGGSIQSYQNHEFAYDQSDGRNADKSIDLRFNTDLPGAWNFMLAGYYLDSTSSGHYYVGANTLDYGQTLFGAIGGPSAQPAICFNTHGCIYGTPYYDSDTVFSGTRSSAIYGEAYYDMVPDTLKWTVGLRLTQDTKESISRTTVFNGYIPTGTTDENAALLGLVTQHQADFDTTNGTPPYDLFQARTNHFAKATGRVVLDWTPKLDFSDQTTVYASYSRGYKAGGSNPSIPQGGAGVGVNATYLPESIDAYEIGTKNTFADGTLQANLTAWYYNYQNLQVSQIVNNTSVNLNIGAYMHGFEGEFLWAPSDSWQFDLNLSSTQDSIAHTFQVDTRNLTGGDPNALLIKDAVLGTKIAQNCVLYYTGSNFASDFATLSTLSSGLFFAPPGGTSALSSYGIAHTAYGSCHSETDPTSATYAASVNNPSLAGLLAFTHFSQTDPSNPAHTSLQGTATDLHGNHLQNTPDSTISIGGQYTQAVGGGYKLVFRGDYYWQAQMWGRIFNTSADKIKSWDVANALITLNTPDDRWYAQAFIKNMFNKTNTTGEYLTSSSSGLWTGVFYGDPRTYGLTVGARF